MKDAGIEAGYLEKYFPRVYNATLLKTAKGAEALTQVFVKNGWEATSADMAVRRIVNEEGVLLPRPELVREMAADYVPDRILPEGRARHNPNAELSRKTKDIPFRELEPFLENNVHQILSRYIQAGVHRAEWARTFGPEGGRLNNLLREGITEMQQAGRPPKPYEIKHVYDLADAFQRSYGVFNKPILNKLTDLNLTYQYMRTMTLSTLTSLPEPLVMFERGRAGANLRALPGALNHAVRETARIVFKGIPKAEATRYAENIGVALDEAMVDLMSNLTNSKPNLVSHAYFKLNFLSPWTRFERVWAAGAGKYHILFNIRDLANGPKGIEAMVAKDRVIQRMQKELVEYGIDPKEAVDWHKRGADQSDPFFAKVKTGSDRFTKDVIMEPRPSNMPLSGSSQHPLARMFWQLKKTQTLVGNTILKRWWNKTARNIQEGEYYEAARNAGVVATTGIAMVYSAVLINRFREWLKYGDAGNPKQKNETPVKEWTRAVDRVGFSGAFQFAYDATQAHRFGRSGIAQTLGPTATQLDEILADPSRAGPNAVPILNTFPASKIWLREDVFNTAESGRTEPRASRAPERRDNR